MNGSRRIRNYFIFEPCVQGEFMCTNQDGNGQLVMADTYGGTVAYVTIG